VLRIDPRSLKVVDTVQIGSSPAALAVFDGGVWTAALAASSTHRGGTLRVSAPVERSGLSLIEPALWFPPAALVYDGLVGYRRAGGSAGGTLAANLASDLPEPSRDGRTYLFRLRRNVRFSNGAPVRPEDVRGSFERVLAMPTRLRQFFVPDLPPIRGAGRCRANRCDLSKAIETNSAAGTVAIHLSRPDPDALHKLHNVFIVPSGSPSKPVTTRPLPGTGPYMIERWDPRRGGQLVRNPRFQVWSPEARPDGFPDKIAVQLQRQRAQVAAVEEDAADIAVLSRGIGSFAQLRARHGARLHTDPFALTWYAFVNVHAPPFDDPRVRRALNLAVDRDRVAEIFGTPETHTPTCQLLPPGLHGYAPSCRFTVNPNAAGSWIGPDMATARQLVDASGTRGMKVEFWGTREWAPLGRYFVSLLSELGYHATARRFDELSSIFASAAGEPRQRPQLGLWAWEASSAGRFSFLKPLVSCAGEFNLSRFCDPEMDAQMERAADASGPEATELWRRVETSLAVQAPTVPLVNESSASLTAKRVENYQHHPLWGPLLDQLWVR
jgi:peptide/nickel transport system substrate-binding protein